LCFAGLGHNARLPLDAAFEWQDSSGVQEVRVIQGNKYYTYNMKTKKKVSGPNDLSKDYSLNATEIGGITAAFGQNKKVYFFTPENFYVWTLSNGTTGSIGPKQSTKDQFFKCGKGKPTDRPVSTQCTIGSTESAGSSGGNSHEKTDSQVMVTSNPDTDGSSSDSPVAQKSRVYKVMSSIKLLATVLTLFVLQMLI